MTLEGIHAIYITVPSPSERLVGTGEFVIPALLVPEQADHGFKPDGALAFRFTATAFSLLVGWLIRNGGQGLRQPLLRLFGRTCTWPAHASALSGKPCEKVAIAPVPQPL